MSAAARRTIVIALVGPTGSGKTTLIDALAPKLRGLVRGEWASYFEGEASVHKEGYMGSNAQQVHGLTLDEIDNSLVVSKLNYLAAWLNSMRYENAIGRGLVVSDRCPYDVASYVERPEILLALATAIRDDLELMGIFLKTILVTVDPAERRKRVEGRLRWSRERLKYREDDAVFQDRTAGFFSREERVWDETIKSSGVLAEDLRSLIEAMTRILARARSRPSHT